MIVAISQRHELNKNRDDVDSLEHNYVEYFQRFGIMLIPIPNITDVGTYFDNLKIKGIILSGGNDIDPSLYNKKEKTVFVSKERDNTEKKLLDMAVARRLPVLGICRGMQFINVYFGGSLSRIDAKTHVRKNHMIRIVDNKFKELLEENIETNSFHDNVITKKDISTELKLFAVCDDDAVEGIYHPHLPILGVMWHPERKSPDKEVNEKIMKWFVSGELFNTII